MYTVTLINIHYFRVKKLVFRCRRRALMDVWYGAGLVIQTLVSATLYFTLQPSVGVG